MTLTVHVELKLKNQHRLQDVAARVRDMRAVWGPIAAEFIQAIHRNVESRGEYFGKTWPEIAAFTKEVMGRDASTPLRDSGSMLGSLQVTGMGVDYVEVSARAFQAGIQQHGATIQVTEGVRNWFLVQGAPLRKDKATIRVPARPWFPEDEEDLPREVVDRMGESIKRYIEEGPGGL